MPASPRTSPVRSDGSSPSSAVCTIAESRSAGTPYAIAEFRASAAVFPCVDGGWTASSAAVGSAVRAVPNSCSVVCRLRRVSCCSEVSTWSNCTGVAVWSTGIVSPSEIVGATGVPGLQVDEEVALEEDARADLELGVLVDRAGPSPSSPS